MIKRKIKKKDFGLLANIGDHLGIITDFRVKGISPQWYVYDIRGTDGNWCSVEPHVNVDWEGCFITETPFDFGETDDPYIDITESSPETELGVLFDVNIQNFISMKRPSKSLSKQDMFDYGYLWDGMFPITAEEAKELQADVCVYMLYDDNSESECPYPAPMIETWGNDGTMFGIEKPDWYAYLGRKKESLKVV